MYTLVDDLTSMHLVVQYAEGVESLVEQAQYVGQSGENSMASHDL